jgi:hypothetical protein
MVFRASLFFLFFIFSASTVYCEIVGPPLAVEGYVTRAVSFADFDVNGLHIVAKPKAGFWTDTASHDVRQQTTVLPYLGQSVSVYGDLKKKKREVSAEDVVFHPVGKITLSGMAVVERIISPAQPGNTPPIILLRADGYLILLNASTKIGFDAPLSTKSDIKTNVWIVYHGKLQSDGVLLADNAIFSANTVVDKEAKLLDKNDYDPAAVDPESKQNLARTLFLGIDPKKIPPYKDAAMQARVSTIGAKLVPVYQRELPDSDSRKILFKFQLVDEKRWKDAITLPTGIILIPYQLIERLQNDSQIAALVADNMATAIEKQAYRMSPAMHAMIAANLASSAVGIAVPGVGLVTSVATYTRTKSMMTDLMNQSGRVSLGLLHDAGYDINQAPVAWWRLAAHSPTEPLSSTVPPRAANLYKSLDTTWHNYSEPSTPAPATLPTK